MIAGDLFEKEEDLTDDRIWKDAGSEVTQHIFHPALQNPHLTTDPASNMTFLLFFGKKLCCNGRVFALSFITDKKKQGTVLRIRIRRSV